MIRFGYNMATLMARYAEDVDWRDPGEAALSLYSDFGLLGVWSWCLSQWAIWGGQAGPTLYPVCLLPPHACMFSDNAPEGSKLHIITSQ